MNLSDRYNKIEFILREHFKDRIINVSYGIRGRIRTLFSNHAILDIRYPVNVSYSFYLSYNELIFRIDTSPYHKDIETFPNHCHFEQ